MSKARLIISMNLQGAGYPTQGIKQSFLIFDKQKRTKNEIALWYWTLMKNKNSKKTVDN